MDTPHFLTFIHNHWQLTALAVVLLALLIKEEFKGKRESTILLSPEASVSLVNKKNAMIIDLQDMETFQKEHIINARNMPAGVCESELEKVDKATPILITCSQGQQAISTAKRLRRDQFQNVYVLKGGIKAWKAAGLPVTRHC